jgi:hypothetical protein
VQKIPSSSADEEPRPAELAPRDARELRLLARAGRRVQDGQRVWWVLTKQGWWVL